MNMNDMTFKCSILDIFCWNLPNMNSLFEFLNLVIKDKLWFMFWKNFVFLKERSWVNFFI